MPKKNNVPSAKSEGEEMFLLHCKAYKLEPQREVELIPNRKCRFDFYFRERGPCRGNRGRNSLRLESPLPRRGV